MVHRAWAQTLGVDVPLLSDWNGDATRAFDVAFEPLGMRDVAVRSAFLVRDGESIEAAWLLGGELPDIDAVIAAAETSASDLHAALQHSPAVPEGEPAQ